MRIRISPYGLSVLWPLLHAFRQAYGTRWTHVEAEKASHAFGSLDMGHAVVVYGDGLVPTVFT